MPARSPGRARQHVRAAAALREGAGQGPNRRTCRRATTCSSSVTWQSTAPASDDRDAEGLERPGAVRRDSNRKSRELRLFYWYRPPGDKRKPAPRRGSARTRRHFFGRHEAVAQPLSRRQRITETHGCNCGGGHMVNRNGAISAPAAACVRERGGCGDAAGNALSEPRGGSSGHHPRHPVGRRSVDGAVVWGARRPPRACGSRPRPATASAISSPRRMSMRCRRATSPPRRCSRIAGRTGIFYRVAFEDLSAPLERRPGGRPFPHPGCRSRRFVRLVGDTAAEGHRCSARRHAHLCDDAAQPAGFLHPLRRQHLCRMPARRRAEAP